MRRVIQVRDGVIAGTATMSPMVEAVHDEDSGTMMYVVDVTIKAPIEAAVEEVESGISATRVDTGQDVFLKITPKS